MRHEELLREIQVCFGEDYDEWTDKKSDALRAVVELHKPKSSEYFDKDVCVACTPDIDTFAYYPCLTIQVIEKALD